MLTDILVLLGLTDADETMTAKIQTIMDITEQRLMTLLGGITEIPDDLKYIVTEVSIVRFNRIGSEGVTSHNVQGESMSWSEKDFKPYADEIQAYLDAQEDPSTDKGRIRFI